MGRVFFDYDADIVDLYKDPVFKAVFTKDTPESLGALGDLLSGLLGHEVEVFAVVANEPPVENTKDRQIRYDVNCRFASGELVNVEMTVSPDAHEVNRLEYYEARLHASQNLKGKDVSYEDVKATYQVSFVVNQSLFQDDVLIHRFRYYDEVNGISLGGCSNIITVELTKLDNTLQKATGETTLAEDWATFVRYGADKDWRHRINEILAQREGIAMAAQTLLSISQNEVERARLLSEYKFLMDHQSRMVDAKREGKLEMAKNLHVMGLSDEQIAKAAELSIDKVKSYLYQ